MYALASVGSSRTACVQSASTALWSPFCSRARPRKQYAWAFVASSRIASVNAAIARSRLPLARKRLPFVDGPIRCRVIVRHQWPDKKQKPQDEPSPVSERSHHDSPSRNGFGGGGTRRKTRTTANGGSPSIRCPWKARLPGQLSSWPGAPTDTADYRTDLVSDPGDPRSGLGWMMMR